MAAVASTPRPKAEVSAASTASVAGDLAPWCRPCQAHHPKESLFRAAPLLGRLVLIGTAPVVLARTKTWLGCEAKGDVQALRRQLLLRYLRCYAPTTSAHFADWAGITKADATQRWASVADTLVPVHVDVLDRKAFVLEEDLDAVQAPAPSSGVRLLPAKDVYLQARDRDLLFPDPAHRKAVFPTLGGPGVVLSEGRPVGTWRGAAKGKRYAVTIQPLARLAQAVLSEVEAEAARLAHVRGHERASVDVLQA